MGGASKTKSHDEKRQTDRGGVNKLQDGGRGSGVTEISGCGSRNSSIALVFACQRLLRLTQAGGGRGTGTEQNKPLGRQLEQEARKERVFHPEEDWQTHWDCDKTATQ